MPKVLEHRKVEYDQGEILLHKNPEQPATHFYQVESGKLGVRANDDEKSPLLFESLPGMITGESGIFNRIGLEEKWPGFKPIGRNACVYALEQTELIEYYPEQVEQDIQDKNYDLAEEILRVLLGHTFVNWYRLIPGEVNPPFDNDPPAFIQELAEGGKHITKGFITNLKQDLYSDYKKFKSVFLTYYHFRDYSRTIYTRYQSYEQLKGVELATKLFGVIFKKDANLSKEEAFRNNVISIFR